MNLKKTNALPLALIFSLFFLWAISSNLLPTMIRQLMKTCELSTFGGFIYRNSLLACLFYIPYTYCYVYEEI